MHVFTIALAALALLGAISATLQPKTICYHESWVQWEDSKIDSEDIGNTLCTHMAYSYFGIDEKTHEIKLLDKYSMNIIYGLNGIDRFVKNAGKAKAFISIGEPSMALQLGQTAASNESRTAFVKSVVDYMNQNNFHGVILNWYDTGRQFDKPNMIALLDKFDELLVGTAFSLGITLRPMDIYYYDIRAINTFVDFINVRTLDYPLHWGDQAKLLFSNQFETLEYFHSHGFPRSKLVMAVPFYARTWNLRSSSKKNFGGHLDSKGSPGPFTQTAGLLSYIELCTMIKSNPQAFSITHDDDNDAVYAIYTHGNATEFITFEDSKTLAKKAHNITSEGYAGISVYAMSYEDTYGICGEKYPLLNAITKNYNSEKVMERPDVTRPPPTPRPTLPPFVCPKEGAFRDPVYCFLYTECTVGDSGGFVKTEKRCDRLEAFDEDKKKCVPKENFKECEH